MIRFVLFHIGNYKYFPQVFIFLKKQFLHLPDAWTCTSLTKKKPCFWFKWKFTIILNFFLDVDNQPSVPTSTITRVPTQGPNTWPFTKIFSNATLIIIRILESCWFKGKIFNLYSVIKSWQLLRQCTEEEHQNIRKGSNDCSLESSGKSRQNLSELLSKKCTKNLIPLKALFLAKILSFYISA